jgi:hypothetical protein
MLYAENSRVRTQQAIGDGLVAAWCALWVWIAYEVHRLLNKLAVPGEYLQRSGESLSGGTDRLPSVVRGVGGPLDSLGNGIAEAGGSQVSVAHDIALVIALLIALGPTIPVIAARVWWRLKWVRSASAAARLRRSPGFDRLMAQRALARQPMHKLAAVHPGHDAPEAEVEHSYATLELNELGLKQSVRS